MKRILSAALAAIMVMSVACIGITVTASEPTLDSQNTSVKALRYDGDLIWDAMGGKDAVTANPVDFQEVKSGTSGDLIELDGSIYESEWGKPTLIVDSSKSGNIDSKYASADNSYLWVKKDPLKEENPNFKLWLRWDDDYFYIAAEVYDPDGAQNAYSGKDIWSGDALQFRVDSKGPNSVVGGSGYDAKVDKYEEDGLNSYYTLPWADSKLANDGKNNSGELYSRVGNFGVAYSEASFKTEFVDMALRYNMHTEQVTDSNGNPVLGDDGKPQYKDVWYPADMYPGAVNKCSSPNCKYNAHTYENYGDAYAAVAAKLDRTTTENKSDIIYNYEIALPWSYVDNIDPQIGTELGMSVVALTAANDSTYGKSLNKWLTWGTGICNGQINEAEGTVGGSNSVILSGDDYKTATCDHTEFGEPDCTHGYICTGCGYEIGYPTGHDYDFINGVSVTETSDGAMTAKCATCGETKNIVIPKRAAEKYVSYDQSSTSLPSAMDDFEKNFYRDPASTKPMRDVYGNQVTSIQIFEDGITKVVNAAYPSFGNYVQFDNIKDIFDSNKKDPSQEFDGSYAVEFDFLSKGWVSAEYQMPDPDNPAESRYRNGVYHWFGGEGGTSFMAGYFPAEDKIMILENTASNMGEGDYVALVESEKLNLQTDEWYNFRTEYDFDTSTMFVYLNDELIVYAWNPEFSIQPKDSFAYLFRTMDIQAYYKNISVTSLTYGKESAPAEEYTVTVDGVATTYKAGDTVTLTVPGVSTKPGEEGTNLRHRFYQWVVESGDVTVENNSFVMPAGDVVITADTVLIGDISGNGKIAGNDLTLLKRHIAGNIELTDKMLAAADINGDGKIQTNEHVFLKKVISGAVTPSK